MRAACAIISNLALATSCIIANLKIYPIAI